ncbi:X-ray repair cross-complementing protein 6 [Grus americana]|uniref:X-ray repair cross-complementing protein 6 n=1 Tax=Grus americana TaxID=9117 RepID=UPI0024080CDE|nr:X-ray repair cross-complementing protein 6 [Grus americana]
MSDWVSYYRSEGPEEEEDEQQQQEEGAEVVANYKFSGRDSLIFLVDASKAMFECEGDGVTPFEMTIQCIRNVYTSKIISSDRDLLSVVFYGTEKNKNSADFKHIYVLQELDNPGAKRVLELDKYRGDEGRVLFRETFGHNADYSLGEALWACSNLFSDVRVRLSHKRIMLFTNEDDPHANDSAKAKLARTRAGDLRDTGIILDLMHLKKPGGFDISLFYRDIINIAEDEDLGIQPEESGKLEHLMKKVRAKETKKRALARLNLYLNKDLSLSVGVYNLVQKAYKPYPVKLYRETNEPVKTKTRMFNGKTGSLLLPSDTKRAQTYGNRQIVLEKEETEELKRFDSPGLFLIGFKPLSMLKQHHHIRPSQFIYPEESLVSGSTTLFNALLTKCLEREVMALCRYTARRNIPPRFVALVPQEEEVDEQKVQIAPPGFHIIFLPYADDKRNVDFTEKVPANREQVDKMKEIIQKLRFKYRTDSFENPVLQQHFRNLEALALDMMEPEEAEDLTMPKAEEMNRRLGNLVEEFKQLVYPPDYSPDGKAVKRKQASDGQTEKRPKVEISEDELRSHVQKGTLGKLTVPVLKDACRLYRLQGGGKKQELMDALIEYFNEH